MARLPELGTSAARVERSKSSARQFAEIIVAAAVGMMPALASARASAAWKSSMDWTVARSEKNGSILGEKKRESRSGMKRV